MCPAIQSSKQAKQLSWVSLQEFRHIEEEGGTLRHWQRMASTEGQHMSRTSWECASRAVNSADGLRPQSKMVRVWSMCDILRAPCAYACACACSLSTLHTTMETDIRVLSSLHIKIAPYPTNLTSTTCMREYLTKNHVYKLLAVFTENLFPVY